MTIGSLNVSSALERVEATLKEDKSISPQVRTLMELLVLIVNLLLTRLGITSSNSSKPPSQDPKRKRGSKKKAQGEKRKPGGQKGHEGTTLKPDPNPDKIETIEVDRRTLPTDDYTAGGFESRQVVDIQITKHVTEYRAEILVDSTGQQWVAAFPDGVTRPVQYGASVKAESVYMSQQQLIPYERVQDYFSDQAGIPLSTGSVFNFNKEAYERLAPFEAHVIQALIKQDRLNADETGINVNGKGHWLHVLSNERFTYFFPHENRGGPAMEAIGVLPHFKGNLIHDHWKAYFKYEGCTHSLCNAHHLRELEHAWEFEKQKWAEDMQKLLCEMRDAKVQAGGAVTDAALITAFDTRYEELLTIGDSECPLAPKVEGKRGRTKQTKARNLLTRFRDFKTETLRFLTNKVVPFTNNDGERDLRMTKVQQKISGCFRAEEGAKIFCRNRSYISTCRKRGIAPTEALRTLFSGRLPDFIAQLE